MPARLTLYPPRRASRFLVIRESETLLVGRDMSCDLVLEDSRVSKRHARLRWTGRGWTLQDLGSKNGTTVNDEAPTGAALRAGDRLSFGGLEARFELLTEAQAAIVESERLARVQTSAALQRRLGPDLEPVDLLLRLLEAAMEVTGAQRGFVLVAGDDGSLHAEVAAGFASEDTRDERFRGSAGAVRQALESGGPVVVSDVRADPRLSKRPSVVNLGIGSLACLPLRHEEQILGVIYVDSSRPGPAFKGLDLQILEALADHAAKLLARHPPEKRAGRAVRRAGNEMASQLQQRLQELLSAE